MAKGLPCPNPSCNHLFSQGDVQGAAALTCPRCGTVFQFRSGDAAPAGPPVAKPQAAPVATPFAPPPAGVPIAKPVVKPTGDPAPVAKPVVATPAPALADEPADALTFSTEGVVSPLHRPHDRLLGRGRLTKILVLAVVLGGAAAGVGWLVLLINESEMMSAGSKADGELVEVIPGMIKYPNHTAEVCRLTLPKGVWAEDRGLRTDLEALIAVQREKPLVWLAVTVRDYSPRQPRTAEMVEEAVTALKGHFKDELVTTSAKPADFAGQRVQRLEFQGRLNDVLWRGEGYLLAHQGYGYCVLVAAAGNKIDDARKQLAELQKSKRGFEPRDARPGWTEEPPKLAAFGGGQLPFVLKAPEGVWQATTDLKKIREHLDEAGVLHLKSQPKKDDPVSVNPSRASVLVRMHEEALSPKEAVRDARKALADRHPGLQIQPLTAGKEGEAELGIEGDVGNKRGQLVELQGLDDGNPIQYVLLAVIVDEGRTLTIECECHWDYHPIWHSEFRDLLATFELRGK